MSQGTIRGSMGQLQGFRALCRPQILQAANASVTYNAVERAVPELNRDGIADLARHCPHVFLQENPDDCSTNRRKKAQSLLDSQPFRNVHRVDGRCGSHQCFRIVANGEKHICGDFHAVGMTCSNTANRNRILHGLRCLIDEDLCDGFRLGAPPAEVGIRNRAIMRTAIAMLHKQLPSEHCEEFLVRSKVVFVHTQLEPISLRSSMLSRPLVRSDSY